MITMEEGRAPAHGGIISEAPSLLNQRERLASASAEQLQYGNQNTGADEGDDDTSPETEDAREQVAGEKAADDRANQPYNDIADTAIATTTYDGAGEKASNQTYDQPGQQPAGL
jgi:hypothetical protein